MRRRCSRSELDAGFAVLGFIVIFSALATTIVKIPGHSTLFDGEPYTPADVIATEALARITALEEKLHMHWQPGAPLLPPRRSADAIDENGHVWYTERRSQQSTDELEGGALFSPPANAAMQGALAEMYARQDKEGAIGNVDL